MAKMLRNQPRTVISITDGYGICEPSKRQLTADSLPKSGNCCSKIGQEATARSVKRNFAPGIVGMPVVKAGFQEFVPNFVGRFVVSTASGSTIQLLDTEAQGAGQNSGQLCYAAQVKRVVHSFGCGTHRPQSGAVERESGYGLPFLTTKFPAFTSSTATPH